MANDVQELVLKPSAIRHLMRERGIRNIRQLSLQSGASYSSLYLYLKRKRKGIGVLTRRRLAEFFPGNDRLFFGDILPASAQEEPRADA